MPRKISLKFLTKIILSIITFFPSTSLSMLISNYPKNVLNSIFCQLSNKDLCSFRLVSHSFNNIAPIILADGSLSFVPNEKELSNLVKYALLNDKKDMLNALEPHAKKIPFEYKWATDFTYNWNISPEKAVLSFETLNSKNYDEIVSKLSSNDKEHFLLPIMIDQESIEHLRPLIKYKQKYPGWFSHNMELSLWADKPKAFDFLSEHFPIIPINTYVYPLDVRASVWKAKEYFKQGNEIDAMTTLQEAKFSKQFIACLVFKRKEFNKSTMIYHIVPPIAINDFDAYISQISQEIRPFDPEISDYLSRVPHLLYPDQKESYMTTLLQKNGTNTLTLEYLITSLNEKLEEIIQDTMQRFVCLTGIRRKGNKTQKLISIKHTTFWIKEFLERNNWKSSAKIFNLCNNFEQAIIKPLYHALKKNDLITLRSLLTHIESVQHYFSCNNYQIMWIDHILLLYKAIELNNFEAFFLLYSLHLHYNDNCTLWFEHNTRHDKAWEIFHKLKVCLESKAVPITNEQHNQKRFFDIFKRFVRYHVPYILIITGFLISMSYAFFPEIHKDQLQQNPI